MDDLLSDGDSGAGDAGNSPTPDREAFLDRLSQIQGSISVGAPLQEVLDAISAGAAELLGEAVVALRLIDEERPGRVRIVSSVGLSADDHQAVSETAIDEGLGGRAIATDSLVVSEDYARERGGLPHFVHKGLTAAMAAPVRDGSRVIGSLVIASYERGRRYSAVEREMLLAFAAHASISLTQARIVAERERLAERHGEERYRLIIDTTNEGVCVLDADDRIVIVNEALTRMLGIPAADLVGRRPAEFRDEATARLTRTILMRGRRGARETFERTIRRGDGRPLHVVISASPLMAADGTYAGAMAMISDVTALREAQAEQTRLQERLRRAQNLEQLGTLAGQVAHDFNNLLAVIHNLTDIAARAVGDEHAAAGDLRRIRSAVEHGSALTSQLLTFSRHDTGTPEVVSLARVVSDAVDLASGGAPPDVELRTIQPENDPHVRIAPSHLRQIVLNLVSNAFDAIGPGGHVEVAVEPREVGDAAAQSHLRPGEYVALVVRDDGEGMDAEVAARALQPMFTTKPSGKGTGFGLAIVARIAEEAGGAVELQSRPGQGTTVEVLLPYEGARLVPKRPVQQTGDPRIILLVEDDDAVRHVTRRLLVEEGYSVLEASNAEEALAVDAASDGALDLIVTDNLMPGSSGVELLERLRSFRSGASAIVMSGYVAGPGQLEPGGRPVTWLQKPFGADGLMAAVSAALHPAAS